MHAIQNYRGSIKASRTCMYTFVELRCFAGPVDLQIGV
uniref:Uncharacterized protein n=1 Tax=Arundo donax TaxID=35708 RepID=A0A0A9HA59_ARUDO